MNKIFLDEVNEGPSIDLEIWKPTIRALCKPGKKFTITDLIGFPIDAADFVVRAAGISMPLSEAAQLTLLQRQEMAEHERGHLRQANTWQLDSSAMLALAQFELGMWEKLMTVSNDALDEIVNETVKDTVESCQKAVSPDSTPTLKCPVRTEAPCKNCSRKNTVGDKKCWWCETSDPC